jgi:hypothetical protein
MNNIKNLNFHKIFKYYFIDNNIDYITGVWKVLDKLTETEKKELTINLGYKIIYPITQLFNLLNNNETFCLNYKKQVTCNICGFNKEENIFEKSLLFYSNDEITNKVTLNQKLFNYTKSNNSRCPYCGIYKDGSIKTSLEYLNSLNFICKDINYPKFLSLCFDLGNEYNFQPLFDKQKFIGNIFDENLILGNVESALCGLILCPTPIHYSCVLYKIRNDIFGLFKNNSYYMNCTDYPCYIKDINIIKSKEESIIDFIKNKNIYILIYYHLD